MRLILLLSMLLNLGCATGDMDWESAFIALGSSGHFERTSRPVTPAYQPPPRPSAYNPVQCTTNVVGETAYSSCY